MYKTGHLTALQSTFSVILSIFVTQRAVVLCGNNAGNKVPLFLKIILTVTFLGEQADWIIKDEISRAINQQLIFMPSFQMTYRGSLKNKSTF
ncbi:MAG: hypothetical protein D3903_11845 [Candidatus Electrothrix sp. GM3_4]|nr:hypothetical protein [Candidatus Electrothrix sp. GM3_4]